MSRMRWLLEARQDRLQVCRRLFRLRYVFRLPGEVRVEAVQHGRGVVFDLLDVDFQQLVQLVHPDVVAGTALEPPAVIGPAPVGVLDIPAAHGEHRGAAVAALQEAGVGVVVLFLSPVVGGGAGFPQGAGRGKGAVVDDLLVVALDDDVVQLVPADVPAVDLLAGVFALPEGSNVKIVVQDALDRHDGPGGLDGAAVLLPGGKLALLLRHAGGGDALVRELVGDLFVAPAVDIELEDSPDDLRLGGDHLELLVLIHDVAVGGGADPLAVLLAALDDGFDLLAGVGDGHLVDEELELDFQPVVVVGEVDVVPDGDDAHPRVPEVLQLHQAPGVAPGEAGEVLDDEDVLRMAHQLPAHGLVALPLLEGVAGAVPVLVESQGAVRETALDEVREDGLLVFDGGVVPVQLLVHGDAAVTGDVKFFNHLLHPLDISLSDGQILRCSPYLAFCGNPRKYR